MEVKSFREVNNMAMMVPKTDQMYLNIEYDLFHDVNPFRECFGHLLHAVEVLHRLLDISVLLQEFKLT